MKLILTFPSGRVVELDEVPVHVEMRGDPDGETHPGITVDCYTELMFFPPKGQDALRVNNLNPKRQEWQEPGYAVMKPDEFFEMIRRDADDCVTVDAVQATH